MKHCPKCNENYHDKFESCFRCGSALEEGEVAEKVPIQVAEPAITGAERDVEEAKGMLELAKTLVILVVVGVVAVAGWSVVTDTRIPIAERYTYVLREGDGPEVIPGGGVANTQLRHQEVRDLHGLTLPDITEGKEMLLYYPLPAAAITQAYAPEIVTLQRDDKGLLATVGLSAYPSAAANQLLDTIRGAVGQAGSDGRSRPLQVVVVARVPSSKLPVRFAVPESLGGAGEEAALAEVGRALGGDGTLRTLADLFWYIVGGGLVLLFFIWMTLKMS